MTPWSISSSQLLKRNNVPMWNSLPLDLNWRNGVLDRAMGPFWQFFHISVQEVLMKNRSHPPSKKWPLVLFQQKLQGLVKYGKHGIGRIVDTWVGGLDSLIQVYDNFIEFQEDLFFQMLGSWRPKKAEKQWRFLLDINQIYSWNQKHL